MRRTKGTGYECPVQGARNGPRMDEDSVGPRHWVAGGPVGYKHGMRDARGGRGQERGAARAAQQPLGNRTWDAASGPQTGRGKGEQDIAGSRTNRSRERWVTGSAKQQPRGIGKPVAMER